MTAYKSFTTSDLTVVPFVVNKSFTFVGESSFIDPNVGIDRLIGLNSNTGLTTGFSGSYFQTNIYSAIKQLYYTNFIPNPVSGSVIFYEVGMNSGGYNVILDDNTTSNVYSRFDNYLQTTLSQSRYFSTEPNSQIGVISIPSKLYGDYINPSTFIYSFDGTSLYDNGEGNLIESGSENNVGVITYQHGLAIITSASLLTNFTTSLDITCSFQSSRTIYETQYRCTLRENEFNFSLNPSIISSSMTMMPLYNSCSIDRRGIIYDYATGSFFNPYVTTVGLYNESQELLAVAKLSQPLPTSRTTDMTIIINLDM